MNKWLASQEFYELCQSYRHARIEHQDDVSTKFYALKAAIKVQHEKELESLRANIATYREVAIRLLRQTKMPVAVAVALQCADIAARNSDAPSIYKKISEYAETLK